MNYGNSVVKKMNFNGQKVKKWYHNGVKVFSSGNIVTYNVDAGTSYQEEVDSEATVLSPKTFTPTKSGWDFVGWREDKTASSSVLQSKIMGDDPMTLYAVFKRTLTTTFNGNGATSGSVSAIYATQYYNNGNYNNPTITLPANGFTRTNFKFTSWNLGAVGDKVTISDDTTVSAQWKQTVYTYGYTGGMQSFTAPETGTYQLEVWGAQGTSNATSGQNGTPGYGGYGKGNVALTKGQVIYICVGGMGRLNGSIVGGYNGGGRGWGNNASCGGGATHIGTKNTVLTGYGGSTSGLFIVAGGGGAGGWRESGNSEPLGYGGPGGGSSGGSGTGKYGYAGAPYSAGGGGSQTEGGASESGDGRGYFGRGGYVSNHNYSGGGGGLYGGGAGNTWDDGDANGGGGGGSGYIGGVTNGSWSNGVRSGDGYATITIL